MAALAWRLLLHVEFLLFGCLVVKLIVLAFLVLTIH